MSIFHNLMKNRKQAYRRLFLSNANGNTPIGDAEVVLSDLARFCRATKPTLSISRITGNVDPYAMALAEGRREVWNRIMAHLHLEDAVIFNLKETEQE